MFERWVLILDRGDLPLGEDGRFCICVLRDLDLGFL